MQIHFEREYEGQDKWHARPMYHARQTLRESYAVGARVAGLDTQYFALTGRKMLLRGDLKSYADHMRRAGIEDAKRQWAYNKLVRTDPDVPGSERAY